MTPAAKSHEDDPSESRGATTRERLLDAARACLIEQGHQACSVKAIAGRAGVNHGLVHHYFGSKEQLWLELIAREAERVRGALDGSRVRFLDGFYLPSLLRHPDRMRLAVELLGLAKTLPDVGQALREHFRLNRQAVQRQLGIADEVTGTLVFGALFGMAIQGTLDPDLPVQAAAERLLALLEDDPAGAESTARSRRHTRAAQD